MPPVHQDEDETVRDILNAGADYMSAAPEKLDVYALLTPNLYDDDAASYPTIEAFRRACLEVYGTTEPGALKRLGRKLHPDKGGDAAAFAYWNPALVAAREVLSAAVDNLNPMPGPPHEMPSCRA